MGVSQNEAAGTGSLSQGSVSRVCFVVCFGGLLRTVLLPRTFKFKGSVSGSVSKVCFGVCFGGLIRQSRTSQPYLKLHSPKKCKPICCKDALGFAWLKMLGKRDPNDILPKGGDLMVMNSMVQAAKKSPTKHIQAIKGGK